MPDNAVIKALICKAADLLDMLWREVGTQLDDDIAAFQGHDEGIAGHDRLLLERMSKECPPI
jgi:hypothetical protein